RPRKVVELAAPTIAPIEMDDKRDAERGSDCAHHLGGWHTRGVRIHAKTLRYDRSNSVDLPRSHTLSSTAPTVANTPIASGTAMVTPGKTIPRKPRRRSCNTTICAM